MVFIHWIQNGMIMNTNECSGVLMSHGQVVPRVFAVFIFWDA